MHIYSRGASYVYRRRIPKQLQQYIHITEFKRSLTKDLKSARMIASKYDLLFNKMEVFIKLGLSVSELLGELGLNTTTKIPNIKPVKVDVLSEFLATKEGIAKGPYREYELQLTLIQLLLPNNLKGLSHRDLDAFKQVLTRLPKRNIQKYREMSLKQVIKADVEDKDCISIKTRNEYLKTLRALIKFSYSRDYIPKELEVTLFKNTTSARKQKEDLTSNEVTSLVTNDDERISAMSKILYYSGMRLSEVYKCKLLKTDGVLCFDLSDTKIELKNESSHRLIPVHSSISKGIEGLLDTALSMRDKWYTRSLSKFLGGGTKTLYSLRHTFANTLSSKGIETNIISELMGHVQGGMTASRYIKGYDIKLLQEAVNNL